MNPARRFLGVTRVLIGIGSWVAPDQTMKVFGIDPEHADRFIGRLFGALLFVALGVFVARQASVAADR